MSIPASLARVSDPHEPVHKESVNQKSLASEDVVTRTIELIYASVMSLVLPIIMYIFDCTFWQIEVNNYNINALIKKRLLGGKYIDGTFLEILAKLMGNDLS